MEDRKASAYNAQVPINSYLLCNVTRCCRISVACWISGARLSGADGPRSSRSGLCLPMLGMVPPYEPIAFAAGTELRRKDRVCGSRTPGKYSHSQARRLLSRPAGWLMMVQGER
jgi:hypothetical protein